MNYDFSSLNDKDFEILVRDLLNAKYSLELQSFKTGKDKGVDLRYSSVDNKNSVVVQAKHYVRSNYSNLKSGLKTKELPKVTLLKPDRYIVVTSVELGVADKDELKNILHPFIQTENDVIGRDDLNQYLSEFPEIEKRTFKLWFSSTVVLENILNNAVEGRTRALLQSIASKGKLLVITDKLNLALKKLSTEKVLLISGEPGVGKSTLADMILFDRARKGFQVHKVVDISEAERIISLNEESEQLFYFDDFLGANYDEIVSAGKTETQMTSFVDRVIVTKNKYLVLTSRTIIWQQAVQRYEKIARSHVGRRGFEIKVKDYTPYEKALILYNHLFFYQVDKKYFDVIQSNQFYLQIVKHPNYSPRIIGFITNVEYIHKLSADQYRQFITNNLNNPKEIWRFSFSHQIQPLDRCLLLTLFSFEKKVDEPVLQAAFATRLKYERIHHNQIISANQFYDSVNNLLQGFVLAELIYTPQGNAREYSFVNPSLADFLIHFVKESASEIQALVSSICFVEQLERLNVEKTGIILNSEQQRLIRDGLSAGDISFAYSSKFKYDALTWNKLWTLLKYCKSIDTIDIVKGLLAQINWSTFGFHNLEIAIKTLLSLPDNPQLISFIQIQFRDILRALSLYVSEAHMAATIPEIFKKFEMDYDVFIEESDGLATMIDITSNVLVKMEKNLTSGLERTITDIEEVRGIYDSIEETEQELTEVLFPNMSIDFNFDININEEYWRDVIEGNSTKFRYSDRDDEDYLIDRAMLKDETDAIKDLFT